VLADGSAIRDCPHFPAAILDVPPLERVSARAGDIVRLLLPTHGAADAVLPDAVEPELQPILVALRRDLPPERRRPGARDGRLQPGLLAMADTAALGGIAAVIGLRGLGEPVGGPARGEGQTPIVASRCSSSHSSRHAANGMSVCSVHQAKRVGPGRRSQHAYPSLRATVFIPIAQLPEPFANVPS